MIPSVHQLLLRKGRNNWSNSDSQTFLRGLDPRYNTSAQAKVNIRFQLINIIGCNLHWHENISWFCYLLFNYPYYKNIYTQILWLCIMIVNKQIRFQNLCKYRAVTNIIYPNSCNSSGRWLILTTYTGMSGINSEDSELLVKISRACSHHLSWPMLEKIYI